MGYLYTFFGWIMKLCYSISFNNYILALFFFALVIQVLLFPLGIKQQKSTVKRAKLRPKEEEIMQKYRGQKDRATQQKMQMEIQEMYKAEGYSPMAGCLPLLIQFPIIFALFGVVRAPLTYTTSLSKASVSVSKPVVDEASGKKRGYRLEDFYQRAYEVIDNQVEAYEKRRAGLKKELDAASGTDAGNSALCEQIEHCDERIAELNRTKASDENKTGLQSRTEPYRELKLIKFMQGGVDAFLEDFGGEGGAAKDREVETILRDKASLDDYRKGSYTYRLMIKEDAAALRESERVYDFNDMFADKKIYTEKDIENGEKNGAHRLPNFDFIGRTTILDSPSYRKLNWLLLVPLLVFLSSFWSSEVTRKLSGPPPAEGQPNPAGGGFMRWGMPAMSTLFAFSFPAAIGIYWTVRSVVVVGQQYLLSKMYPPPVFTESELKEAVKEVRQEKKKAAAEEKSRAGRSGCASEDEREERLRRRLERLEREEEAAKKKDEGGRIEKPSLKDDKNGKDGK